MHQTLLITIIFLVILICSIFSYYYTEKKQKKNHNNISFEEKAMSVPKDVLEVKQIELLHGYIKNLDINERSKELFLDKVHFELDYLKRRLFLSIGEFEYERLYGDNK